MPRTYDPRLSISLAEECQRNRELKDKILTGICPRSKQKLIYSWEFWGRRNQILNLAWAWTVWIICAGRGWGKSRTGAEAVRSAISRHGCRRVALVARTASDARDVMVEGESGLLSICPPWDRPKYERSKRRLTWPNGAIATCYSADNPNLLRGPQHDFAWCDELAAWRYVEESWDNLVMGLRLKTGCCRIVVTTTPRVIPFLAELLRSPGTMITEGSTFDNLKNLHPNVRANLLRYKGTSKEQQELYGKLLGEVDGALWSRVTLDKNRVSRFDDQPSEYRKVVCGVDPETTKGKDSDDFGICVAGLAHNGHTYVIGDYTVSGTKGPEVAVAEIVRVCLLHRVNEIWVETNAGGLMTELLIRNLFKSLNQAHRMPPIKSFTSGPDEDKSKRAEPVILLDNCGMVHHLGRFVEMEQEMTTWVPGKSRKSPNRIDARVFAVAALNPNSGKPLAQAPSSPLTDYKKIIMPKR
jgi:phage terminase large subunit-like protein